MTKKTETPRKPLKINVTTVKDFEKPPEVIADKMPEEKEPKGTPPLFLKKKQATKKEVLAKEVVVKDPEPVTIEEIENTMKDLALKLKDPKTKESAEKKLAELHDRMRNPKPSPTW